MSSSAQSTGADELAQFDGPSAAREAYNSGSNGGDDNGEDDGGDGSGWTEWTRVDQVENWYIYGREQTDGSDVQFHITGQTSDGRQVFIDGQGRIVDNIFTLESMDAVNQALQAYYQRVEDGDTSEGDRPTGADPGPGAGNGSGQPGKGGVPIVEDLPVVGSMGIVGQVAFLAIVGGAAYYYYNDGELPESVDDFVDELPVVGGESA